MKDSEHPFFFVLNSDIVCEYQLHGLLDFHKAHGKQASLMVTHVEDPSKYGIVIASEDG